MNEINLNALSRSAGFDKPLNSVANPKNLNSKKASPEPDSIQFSKLPDLSSVEAALEEEFASMRANLEDDAKSASYPPLETIDRLAHMLAMNLNSQKSELPE